MKRIFLLVLSVLLLTISAVPAFAQQQENKALKDELKQY